MNGCGEMKDSVFHTLYEKYHQELYQFIFYMVKKREIAEDIVQDVYIRVMKSYERFQGKSSEKTWLYAIARNTTIDYFRKQKTWKDRIFFNFNWDQQPVIDPLPEPSEVAVMQDEIKHLYQCLDRCTLDQKTVLILRYIQGFSIAEAAEILSWSESKVKTTQHRALKAVKKLMLASVEEVEENEEARLARRRHKKDAT